LLVGIALLLPALFARSAPARTASVDGGSLKKLTAPSRFLQEHGATSVLASAATGTTLPTGFTDTQVITGLTNPTVVRFASDGRIFVAQKNGLLLEYDGLTDATPTPVIDLRAETDDYWDRGLLGMALDPNFPATPNIYLLYTYDALPGGVAPKWNDACPTPPGPTTDGCPVTGKLVRIAVNANSTLNGSPTVLISNAWCQQYPSHSVGTLMFGADGALYVSGGDGANFNIVDYGQGGGGTGSPTPKNPCGDPPAGSGGSETPPTAEGGALRAQSIGRPGAEPVLLNGSVLRLDPATGAAAAGNPNIASPDLNKRRIIATGLRNPFRFTFRPGTSDLWIGDVGWATWEEIDHQPSPTTSVTNFGWPCYEGPGPEPGYQSTGLNLCNNLYTAGTAVAPYYTYNHSASVVSGDGCPTANGSSITGLAFYTGTTYPATYSNALFFADHTRNCIWAMLPGTNGLPDPTKIQTFITGASNPVDLEIGPNGDLFYADLEGGAIHRVTYSAGGGGSCPAGQFEAKYYANMTLAGTPSIDRCETQINNDWGAGGPAGLPVDGFSATWSGQFTFSAGTYTFSATADDGVRVYVDGTAVIDQWKDQGATTYVGQKVLTAGAHTVRVDYYENTGDAVAKASWQAVTTGSTCPTGQFEAQYFNNTAMTGSPVVDRCEPQINNDWGTGSPAAGVNADNFSTVWQGAFSLQAATYTFTATADDGIRVYVDGSLVINQWKDEAPTTFTGQVPVTAGTHTIRVEYYEHTGGATAKVSWAATGGVNQPPAPVIDSPGSTLTYAVGDFIAFSGHASDPQDGAEPASRLTWTLIIHHCPTPSSCHTHTVQSWPATAFGSFNAPDHSYPSYLELQLQATDSGGLGATTSVILNPKTVNLTFASSPTGLSLAVNGASATAPSTQTVIVNSINSVSAPASQALGGTNYGFSSWSDGGAASHNITAPATSTTYTATYTQQQTGTCPTGQFDAQYFNNMTISGAPVLERCETQINNDWGVGSPAPSVNVDGFSAAWSGTFSFAAGTYAFNATADDGVRVYVDGAIVIDQWKDQAPTSFSVQKAMTAGTHTVRVEYYENGGGAEAQASWQPVASSVTCTTGQFEAQYYNNTSFTGAPVLDRCENQVNNDWGTGSPAANINVDNFSAVWSGSFSFSAKTYTFTVTADDGIRLYVDGAILIDQWKDEAPTTYTAGRAMTAGTHIVRVEYYEKTGGAVAHASWN
jgi:glucose/arabinose dehydrogenase/single-stranded DNA-binding protein